MADDNSKVPGQEEVHSEFMTLVQAVRAGVLITMTADGPFGSHVPFLMNNAWTRVFIHISQLAVHTKNLALDRRIALFVSEPDRPEKNPLALKRINLQGMAEPLAATSQEYETIKQQYLARFPQAAMTFQLPDFKLWALHMTTAHFVAGFGRAFSATHDSPMVWAHQRR